MRNAVLLAASLAALVAATPARADSASDARAYIAKGRALLDKGDTAAAVIELKNAAQSDPTSGEALYLLGGAEYKAGNWPDAERALRGAKAHGYEGAKVDAALAETLLKEQKLGELLSEVPPSDRPADLEGRVRMARGYAFFGLRQIADAETMFEDAIRLSRDPALAEAGLAEVRAGAGQLKEAAALLEKSVGRDPDLADAWLLLGKVRQWQGNATAALEALDKAVALRPHGEPALRARALLLADRDPAKAQRDVDALLRIAPHHPIANTIDAAFKARRGEWRAAELAIEDIGNLDAFPPALYLLAVVEAGAGHLARAEDSLTRYLGKHPRDPKALELKARLLLARGDAEGAVEVLKTALIEAPNDRALTAALADAYARGGDTEKAAALYETLGTDAAREPRTQARLGVKLLGIGQTLAAIADLEKARELGTGSPDAGAALVMAYLHAGEPEKARAAAEALQHADPKSVTAELALGFVALKREGPAAARAHFAKALALRPGFTDAEIDIAQTWRLEKRNPEARAAFAKVLEHDPANRDALLAIADMAAAEGRLSEVIPKLERGRAADPAGIEIRLRLVAAYIADKAPSRALTVAQELRQLAPQDPRAVAALADAELAAGNTQSALSDDRQLVAMTSEAPGALMRLARTLDATGDSAAAQKTIERAVELKPDDAALRQTLVAYAVRRKTVAAALDFARDLARRTAGSGGVDALAGALFEAEGRFSEAAAAYGNGLAKEATGELVRDQATALARAGNGAAGIAALRSWVTKTPGDHASRLALAGLLTAVGERKAAIGEMEVLVKASPDDAMLLNNLAWLYAETGDARAQPMAEKAAALAPASPLVADTLGWILLSKGETARGAALIKKAVAAGNPTAGMRYHLAVALSRSGKPAEARRIVGELLQSTASFDDREAARQLLVQLGG